MKLPWFGPPKWQDPDPAVRLEAVRRLSDQAVLAEVATTDPAREVRLAAVAQLSDPERLASIALGATDENVDALARLTTEAQIVRVARTAVSTEVRCRAVARIDDRQILQRISGEDTEPIVRKQARVRLAAANPFRELLKTALNRLPVAPPLAPPAAKVYGSVDGVCDTLVGDNRFRVHGIVGHVNEPVTASPTSARQASTLEAVVSGATVLELLGNKSPEAAGADDSLNLSSYYHIEIRRTGESDFELKVTERESRAPFRGGGSNPPR